MKPLVSIICTTFNHEKFISKCIISVMQQSYKNWEMLIVDDCSTDKTSKIIEKYAVRNSRIIVIKHKRRWGIKNLSKSYNQALKRSKGDFIAILEGDDYWPKNKLSLQVPVFNNSEIILSYGDSITVNEWGKPVDVVSYDNRKLLLDNDPPPVILNLFADYNFYLKPETVMIRKKTLVKIGGFKNDKKFAFVDFPTWLYLSMEGKFGYSNQILGFYRRHSGSWWISLGIETESMHRNEMNASFWEFFRINRSKLKRLSFSVDRKEIKSKQETILERKRLNKNMILFHHSLLFDNRQNARDFGDRVLNDDKTGLTYKLAVRTILRFPYFSDVLFGIRFRVKYLVYKIKQLN